MAGADKRVRNGISTFYSFGYLVGLLPSKFTKALTVYLYQKMAGRKTSLVVEGTAVEMYGRVRESTTKVKTENQDPEL